LLCYRNRDFSEPQKHQKSTEQLTACHFDSPLPASPLPTRNQTNPRSIPASLALWTFVCVVSAAPSFAWGMGTIAREHYLAMVLGIAVFIALYTWADQFTHNKIWRRIPAIGLTLKIGYVTRLVVSVIFPIGAGLDLYRTR